MGWSFSNQTCAFNLFWSLFWFWLLAIKVGPTLFNLQCSGCLLLAWTQLPGLGCLSWLYFTVTVGAANWSQPQLLWVLNWVIPFSKWWPANCLVLRIPKLGQNVSLETIFCSSSHYILLVHFFNTGLWDFPYTLYLCRFELCLPPQVKQGITEKALLSNLALFLFAVLMGYNFHFRFLLESSDSKCFRSWIFRFSQDPLSSSFSFSHYYISVFRLQILKRLFLCCWLSFSQKPEYCDSGLNFWTIFCILGMTPTSSLYSTC